MVIIGCGFGGLEATRALKDADLDITVVDRQNHHLFQPLLYQVATAGLTAPAIAEPIRRMFRTQRNVTVLMAEVTGLDAVQKHVNLQDGQVLPYDHLIVAASPLGKLVAAATGAQSDRAGRVKVESDLSVKGHPDISVVGDLAAAMSYAEKRPPAPVPGVSPAAKQMGRTAARNILRRIKGQPTQAFRYANYGDLATIGRHSAVADVEVPWLGKLRFTGLPAWLFWLCVHVFFLIGFRNRLVVLIDWAWAYFTFERHARIVVGRAQDS